MKDFWKNVCEMRSFLILWFTQALSGLGSAMTSYALVIRSYMDEGSALKTALLMVCSYAPYVLLSVFAGALSDRWNKKRIMLVCDLAAALTTVYILFLIRTDSLKIVHLYIVNIISGLMNTVQQPASEVVITSLLPRKHYQRVGGLKYLANSASSILTPVIATAMLALAGIESVIAFDLFTFVTAFFALLFLIRVPEEQSPETEKESLLKSASIGINFLKKEKGIFGLILFLAGINLVASMYNAAFPAMMLTKGNETQLGIINTVTGLTMLAGSFAASFVKKPKSRVKAIWICLMLSMCTENFFLAVGKNIYLWCIGAFLGWIAIPMMNANLDAVLRLSIPKDIQGRVFAARNSFQFFTIPLGYLLGGFLVDSVFEPLMQKTSGTGLVNTLFGTGKGSGCALFFFILWLLGILVCMLFRKNKHIAALDRKIQE